IVLVRSILHAAARPCSAFSLVRARKVTSGTADAKIAPLPNPMVPLAPRTTTFLLDRDSARARRALPALSSPTALWRPYIRTPFDAPWPRRSCRHRCPAPDAFPDLPRNGGLLSARLGLVTPKSAGWGNLHVVYRWVGRDSRRIVRFTPRARRL